MTNPIVRKALLFSGASLLLGAATVPSVAWALTYGETFECIKSIRHGNAAESVDFASGDGPAILKEDQAILKEGDGANKPAFTILTPDGIEVVKGQSGVLQHPRQYLVIKGQVYKLVRQGGASGRYSFAPAPEGEAKDYLARREEFRKLSGGMADIAKKAAEYQKTYDDKRSASNDAFEKSYTDKVADDPEGMERYKNAWKAHEAKRDAELKEDFERSLAAKQALADAQKDYPAKKAALRAETVVRESEDLPLFDGNVPKPTTVAKLNQGGETVPEGQLCGELSTALVQSDGYAHIRGREACEIEKSDKGRPKSPIRQEVQVPVTVCGDQGDEEKIAHKVSAKVRAACAKIEGFQAKSEKEIARYRKHAAAHGFGEDASGVTAYYGVQLAKRGPAVAVGGCKTEERTYNCGVIYSNEPCRKWGEASSNKKLAESGARLAESALRDSGSCAKIAKSNHCSKDGGRFPATFAQVKKDAFGSGEGKSKKKHHSDGGSNADVK